VPAEFTGLARAFLTDAEKSYGALSTELEAFSNAMAKRFARRSQVRSEHVDELIRILDVQRLCILDYAEIARGGRKLRCYRPVATQNRSWLDSWTSSEIIADLAIIAVQATPFKFLSETKSVASVSLHALARRMQRGFSTDRQAVAGDLREIVWQANAVLETLHERITAPGVVAKLEDFEFAVRCADGAWFGHARKVNQGETQNLKLIVRTFYSNDEMEAKLAPDAKWLN
jgi:hypothetical protein